VVERPSAREILGDLVESQDAWMIFQLFTSPNR
jgi:hypothetical protein